MRYLHAFLVLLLAGSLAGCTFEPPTDVPLQPLPSYPAWYAEVRACAGGPDDYDRLRFYVLDPEDEHGGITVGHTIWLRPKDSESRLVVEHEMLHSMIGDRDHEDPRWVTCGLDVATIIGALYVFGPTSHAPLGQHYIDVEP